MKEEAEEKGIEAGLYGLEKTFVDSIRPRLSELASVRYGRPRKALSTLKDEIATMKTQLVDAEQHVTTLQHQQNLRLSFQKLPGWRLVLGTVAFFGLAGLGLELTLKEMPSQAWVILAISGGLAFTMLSLQPSLFKRWGQWSTMRKGKKKVRKSQKKIQALTRQTTQESDRIQLCQQWIEQHQEVVEKFYLVGRTRGEGAKRHLRPVLPGKSEKDHPEPAQTQEPDLSGLFSNKETQVTPESELTFR